MSAETVHSVEPILQLPRVQAEMLTGKGSPTSDVVSPVIVDWLHTRLASVVSIVTVDAAGNPGLAENAVFAG